MRGGSQRPCIRDKERLSHQLHSCHQHVKLEILSHFKVLFILKAAVIEPSGGVSRKTSERCPWGWHLFVVGFPNDSSE